MEIPRPCKEEVKKYLKSWDSLEDYSLQERSLKKLFSETYPLNDNLDNVLIKVCALNQFYSIKIHKIFVLSKHIVKLNIDEDLYDNNLDLVGKIASGHGIHIKKTAKESYLFSFATKYCSHHKPEIYPIYDSFVEKILLYFKKRDEFSDFKKEDLKIYPIYKDILKQFSKFYELEDFSLKEIDRSLWQIGKEYFPKKYYNKKPNVIK